MATPSRVQIDDVGRPGAVDVGQADTLLIELIWAVEPRRVVHGDLGAEAAVAEIGPVADLAVADANDVREAVAGQVGEKDRLRAVGKNDGRAFLFVARLGECGSAVPKPSSASDGCQVRASSSVIRMSAWPSPVRSTNLRLGSLQARFGSDPNGMKLSQSLVFGPLEETGHGSLDGPRSKFPSPARSRN